MFLQQRLFHFFQWGATAWVCFLKSLMNLSAGLQKGGKSKMISVALMQFTWRNLNFVWVLLFVQQFQGFWHILMSWQWNESLCFLKNFLYSGEYENLYQFWVIFFKNFMKRIEIGTDVTKFGYKRNLCEQLKIFQKKIILCICCKVCYSNHDLK